MRESPDTSEALAAFIARKSEIETILARLTALSAGHFHCDPERTTSGDVGTAASY
jgi:hypothetical protein